MMKHHNQVVDFFNLDFEAIDIEILADEAREQEEATIAVVGGGDAADVGRVDPDEGNEVVIVGKSGFVSHTKHTAEATITDLLYS